MNTQILATDTPFARAAAVESAAMVLAEAQPVALPTETVYGLAADALRPEAVVKIFEAKERPFFDPLIVHLPDKEWLPKVAKIPEESSLMVEALISRFWPGPLTLVLPRSEIVPDLVTSGLDTVAVRMSAHPVFREIAARFGKPLAAPSANRFGRISPTTAAHVRSELDGKIPLIVDGGPTQHGLESTIVKVNGTSLQILRAGPITPEMLAGYDLQGALAGVRPEAPGQLKSHYAPRTPLRLLEFEGLENPPALAEISVHFPGKKLGLLCFSPRHSQDVYAQFQRVEWLSDTGDLAEAAANLFAKMRLLDEAGLDLIFAECISEEGLGIAIMDRLRKAAAEHE